MTEGHWCLGTADGTYADFLQTKKEFGKEDGRLAYHWEISFLPGETDAEEALEIARLWVREVLGDAFQCLIAVHDDRPHIHAHLIFNSVSQIDGRKFRYENKDLERIFYPALNRLCAARGLSHVRVCPKGTEQTARTLSYREWLEQKKGYASWKEMICADIDYVISYSYNFANFLVNLEDMGYEADISGKYLKLRVPGMEKWARVYGRTFGSEYTEARIRERIEQSEPPKRKIFSCSGKRLRTKRKIAGKKTKLTRFRRQYLYYCYLFGKIQRRPYRSISFFERQENRKIAEEMNYLFFHGIGNKSELSERLRKASAEKERVQEELEKVRKEYSKNRYVFSHAKGYRLCEGSEKAGHGQWLLRHGYAGAEGLQQIRALKEGLLEQMTAMRSRRAELEQELKMLERIFGSRVKQRISEMEKEAGLNGRSARYDKERGRCQSRAREK